MDHNKSMPFHNVVRIPRAAAVPDVSAMTQSDLNSVCVFLREQARSIQDTAARCTDPQVVSELEAISEELAARADALSNRAKIYLETPTSTETRQSRP